MKKKSRRKNRHAVALGRLGGLVRSAANALEKGVCQPTYMRKSA
jgi:hypothetical protein